MKVLVTGATGFIGSHVIPALLKKKCTVIASSANRDNAIRASWFNQVKYIPFDFSTFDDSMDYYAYFENPDILIHLAWEGLPNYKSDFHETINLPRHVGLLSNLIRYGLRDITVTGTCLEYGMQEGSLKEDMPATPTNSYAIAKDQLRQQLEELKKTYPFLLKWVRLFYMYGKGQHANSLLSQLEKALEKNAEEFDMSGGDQVRDYLPVEIVAKNIVSIALQKQMVGIINNCSGVPITVRELVDQYLEQKKKQIKLNTGVYPYPDYEPMRFWGDIEKLKQILENERSNTGIHRRKK